MGPQPPPSCGPPGNNGTVCVHVGQGDKEPRQTSVACRPLLVACPKACAGPILLAWPTRLLEVGGPRHYPQAYAACGGPWLLPTSIALASSEAGSLAEMVRG